MKDPTPLGSPGGVFRSPLHLHSIMRTTSSAYARLRGAVFGVACLVAAAACGSDGATSPTQNEDAARAVGVFTHLADSVSRNGGDAEMGGAYASLAEAVRTGGRVSTIVITVDGVPTTFYAIATLNDVSLAPCAVGFCTMDKRPQSLRTLIASTARGEFHRRSGPQGF